MYIPRNSAYNVVRTTHPMEYKICRGTYLGTTHPMEYNLSEFVKSSESINILKNRLKTELISLVMTSCTACFRVSE